MQSDKSISVREANTLAGQAAFNRRRIAAAGPQQLVENRTVYERHGAELSIYDTFAKADKVQLAAEEVLYCGMIAGKKILHGKNHFNARFLPHESFLMAPGEEVAIDFPDATMEQPTSCLTLGISRDRLRHECDLLNQSAPLPVVLGEWQPRHESVLHLYHTEATQQLLVRIVDSFLSQDTDRDLVLNLGVSELLRRMLRQKGRDFLLLCARQDPTLNGLTDALRYIDDNLAEPVDVEQLCRVACMSRSKFYQLFRQVMGTGPMEYLQQRRLDRARELILAGHSITRVCYDVGYVNPSHFSKRFQLHFGMTPRKFAQLQRPDAAN